MKELQNKNADFTYFILADKLFKKSSIIILLILLFSFDALTSSAQTKLRDNLNVKVNLNTGYNLPEYTFISAITKDYIRSFEISFFKETIGGNIWEQLYNYPDYGISLFYSSLGNDDVLGRELALTYFFKWYFYSKNQFRLFNRVGIGLGLVDRKFDLQSNYLNVAVGSHLNIHFNYKIGANYKLSDKIYINTGLSFDHFSNANTSEPNLGINYLTAYGGISHSIGKKNEKQFHELKEHVKKNNISLFYSIGGKHTRALTSKYFFTSSVSLEVNRTFFQKFHLGIGGDLFYDSSVKTILSNSSDFFKKSYSFQTGIHISQTIVYNKFSLAIQEGMYLIFPNHLEKYKIYNRGIIQYQINNNLHIRLAMKSHLHILDYPEIGFGYKL